MVDQLATVVVLGHCYATMGAPAIGRVAALDAGLPVTVTGLQLDRRCGSGLQAVLYAAMQVQAGASEVVLAGGAESMSNAPFYSTAMRWGAKAGPGVLRADRPAARGKGHFHCAGRGKVAFLAFRRGSDFLFITSPLGLPLGPCRWLLPGATTSP